MPMVTWSGAYERQRNWTYISKCPPNFTSLLVLALIRTAHPTVNYDAEEQKQKHIHAIDHRPILPARFISLRSYFQVLLGGLAGHRTALRGEGRDSSKFIRLFFFALFLPLLCNNTVLDL